MATEGNYPLAWLAEKLKRGPPSISSLISYLRYSMALPKFLSLVREYLPEYEREILTNATPWGRIAAFTDRFRDRYFPLLEMLEEYEELTEAIPADVQGLSNDDYHTIPDWRPGYQLMTYLVEPSYWGRIALAEACADYVSHELLRRVPDSGYPPEQLAKLTRGTRYEALELWARIIWQDTGNFFLDTDHYELGTLAPSWDRETVEALTREWQQAERINQEVLSFAQWLEQDLPGHFEEIVNFLEDR